MTTSAMLSSRPPTSLPLALNFGACFAFTIVQRSFCLSTRALLAIFPLSPFWGEGRVRGLLSEP